MDHLPLGRPPGTTTMTAHLFARPLSPQTAAAVWVRVGGQWRRGRIIEWVRQIDRHGWDCVIMADEPVSGPPWQGRYAFDPRSIRARYTDQPPADLAGAE